jgi:RNA polymerase sigma-70 factor (ECF subfamily)
MSDGHPGDISQKHARFMAHLEPCLARLSRYCHAMTADREEGKDLLSEAVLAAYEHFDSLRAPEAFRSYIFTTARRLYYRRARRKKLWTVLGTTHEAIPDLRHHEAEVRLDTEALDAALKKLPEKQREAIVLFEISGLSLAEIRQIQGGSLSGVKTRLVRGRERLTELLGEPRVPRTPAPSSPKSFERSSITILFGEKA